MGNSKSRIVMVFDLDGTLVDNFSIQLTVVNWLCRKYNQPPLEKARFKELYKDWHLFYKEIGIPVDLEELNKIYCPAFLGEVEAKKPLLFDDVKNILLLLHEKGIRLILLTAQRPEVVELYESRNHFLWFFAEKFIGVEGKESILREIKKRTEAMTNFELQLGTNLGFSEDTIFFFISDTPDDIIAGQKAGWLTIGVSHGFSSQANLEAVSPDGRGWVIDEISALAEIFGDY